MKKAIIVGSVSTEDNWNQMAKTLKDVRCLNVTPMQRREVSRNAELLTDVEA